MNLLISEPLLRIILFIVMSSRLNATTMLLQFRFKLSFFNNVWSVYARIAKRYEKYLSYWGGKFKNGVLWLKSKADIISIS